MNFRTCDIVPDSWELGSIKKGRSLKKRFKRYKRDLETMNNFKTHALRSSGEVGAYAAQAAQLEIIKISFMIDKVKEALINQEANKTTDE